MMMIDESMIIFTMCTHGPFAIKKCYLLCVDRLRLQTAHKRRVVSTLLCPRCCY